MEFGSVSKVCEHFDRGGHWRQLTVRSNSAGQLMLAAVVHPQQLGADAIDAEMRRFADHMGRAAGHLDIHSFLYQAWYVAVLVSLNLFLSFLSYRKEKTTLGIAKRPE